MGSKYKLLLPYLGYKGTSHFIIYTYKKSKQTSTISLRGFADIIYPSPDMETTVTLGQSHFLRDASAPTRKNHYIVVLRVLGTTGVLLRIPQGAKKKKKNYS